jgi:hypothetical protein
MRTLLLITVAALLCGCATTNSIDPVQTRKEQIDTFISTFHHGFVESFGPEENWTPEQKEYAAKQTIIAAYQYNQELSEEARLKRQTEALEDIALSLRLRR